jgi:two-component system cell cycle response regulator
MEEAAERTERSSRGKLSCVGSCLQPKILVSDDEEAILDYLKQALLRMGYSCATARNGADALRLLETEVFDIVLTDIRMPVMDGLTLLREIKSSGSNVDVIIMTGHGMEYSYTDVINMGATDFINKPVSYNELQARISRVLRERHLRSELHNAAITDSLTGLFNRRHFYQRLQQEVRRASRQKYNLCCLILDVDRLKEYNDTYGHQAGDEILLSLSRALTSSIRDEVDSAYRLGGDEFGVILIQLDRVEALRIAERIRKSFETSTGDGCTLSIGVAHFSPDDKIEDFIRRADKLMYEAKRAGGNRIGTPDDSN